MRACDAAMDVLRETGNPAVMWGDEGLLHAIADKLGWKHDAWHTSDRVLRALAQTPGPLEKRRTLCYGHWVLIFRLPNKSGLRISGPSRDGNTQHRMVGGSES